MGESSTIYSYYRVALLAGAMLWAQSCKETPGIFVNETNPVYRQASPSRTLDLGFQPLSGAGLLVSAICTDSLLLQKLDSMNWNLDCVPLGKSGEVLRGLEEGWLDAGVDYADAVFEACAGGTVKVVSVTDQSYNTLITRVPLPLHQIRGKVIGFLPGDNAERKLREYLSSMGFVKGDLRLKPIEVSSMTLLLEQGSIDALALDEPLASLVLLENINWQFSIRQLGRSYFFAHKLLLEDPELLKALMQSQIRQQLSLRSREGRFRAENIRWSYAQNLGVNSPSLASLKLLAEQSDQIGFNTASSMRMKDDFIPSILECADTSFYAEVLRNQHEENSQ